MAILSETCHKNVKFSHAKILLRFQIVTGVTSLVLQQIYFASKSSDHAHFFFLQVMFLERRLPDFFQIFKHISNAHSWPQKINIDEEGKTLKNIILKNLERLCPF